MFGPLQLIMPVLKASFCCILDPFTAMGIIAGGLKDEAKMSQEAGIRLDPASQLELKGRGHIDNSLSALGDLTGLGPGQQQVRDSLSASNSLADMLKQYSQGGNLPSAQDISQGNSLASSLFGARQTALDQSFTDQNTEMERLAARLGRPVNDPILQAKLRTGFMRQQDLLNAEKQGFATEFAMQQPDKRLGYASDRANVLGNLASQAFANRSAMLAAGSSVQDSERNFRLNTGTRWSTSNQESGGGFKGAVEGGLAGASTAIGLAGSVIGLMGGIGGGFGGAGGGNFGLSNSAPMMGSMGNRMGVAPPSMGVGGFGRGRVF